MRNTIKFNLADDEIESQISVVLATHDPIKKEATIVGQLTYYDTFDWRLFNNSLVLFTFQDQFFLRELGKEKTIHSIRIKSVPCFIWEFPKGDLKQYLEPAIKMRKLLKLVDLVSHKSPYRMLDPNGKTVAKVIFETIQTRSRKNPKTMGKQLWLNPVKGYPKYSKKLKSQLENMGLTSSKDENVFFQAMSNAGLDPGGFTSKLRLQLTPDMRADEAIITIWRFLLHVIKVNEVQIEYDIDTEILHDFRVALRRTRSALVLGKNIFPQKIITRFKKDLSFVSKISNELRDLDVYLLKNAKYKAMLPAVLRDDIDPLFDYLGKQRSVSFRKVLRSLNSKKYKKIMQDWEAFLDEPQYDLVPGS
ncbi:MAG: CHAD domain-containing protein, partial [Desulfobacterales bacterium]|nr:CHAD domain-containing protein [Desulfobacterales bacterium]